MKHWTVGQLAERMGITVRTLHHYDEIGLLTPSERSDAGYRLYLSSDVLRLSRILALRALKLSLDDIRACLDDRDELAERLDKLESLLRGEITERRRILTAIETLKRVSAREGRVEVDHVRQLMESVKMINDYYTDEQLEQLDERYQNVSQERLDEVHREWKQVFADLQTARDDGAEVTSDRVQAIARRAEALIEAFTGGDAGIRASLESMYHKKGAEVLAAQGYEVEEGLSGYLRAALVAREG